MKKVIILIMALIIVLGLVGCGNDTEEEDNVKQLLKQSNWWIDTLFVPNEVLGDTEMARGFKFYNDGTFYCEANDLNDVLEGYVSEGTYEIDTRNDTITMYHDNSEESWTYELKHDKILLFNERGEDILEIE